MSKSLPARLREKCAFDYVGAVNSSLKWDARNRGGYELFKDGAEYEHARLAPILERLIECAAALDKAKPHLEKLRIMTRELKMYETYADVDDWFIDHGEALSALREAVGG